MLLEETSDAGVAGGKSVIVTEILMNSDSRQPLFEFCQDDLTKRLALVLRAGADPVIGFGRF